CDGAGPRRGACWPWRMSARTYSRPTLLPLRVFCGRIPRRERESGGYIMPQMTPEQVQWTKAFLAKGAGGGGGGLADAMPQMTSAKATLPGIGPAPGGGAGLSSQTPTLPGIGPAPAAGAGVTAPSPNLTATPGADPGPLP